MALNRLQAAKYNEVVDKVNVLLQDFKIMFADHDKEPEFQHCSVEASRYMEIAFLYFNKGCNLLHIKSAEHVNEVVDEALATGNIKLMDKPPADAEVLEPTLAG